MKYFVTGATGFVGGRVAQLLVEAGHQVNVLARNPARAGGLARLGAAIFAGDVTEKASLRAPMAGTDGVFHIAGWYKVGVKDKRDGQRINVDGTRNVLEMMRELAIPKGVYTSTLAVFSDTHGQLADESYQFSGKHLSEYDRTKAEAHAIAGAFIRQGLPLVIVQPGMVYGPGDTSSLRPTIRQYLRRQLPVIPAQTTLTWGYIDDIARGHLLAMEKGRPGETYIIAGPPHKLTEVFDTAQSITGIPAPRMRLSPTMMRATAALMGLLEKVFPIPETYSAEYLRTTAGTTYIGSNAKARRELGYNPRPLREGLAETLRHEMEIKGD